eukprot:11431894-Alexandrium_andersonii.AAC.1
MGIGHVAGAPLGYGFAYRGGECPRGAQRQGCCTPSPGRAAAPRSPSRASVGPVGVAGRACVCGRWPVTGDPTFPAG